MTLVLFALQNFQLPLGVFAFLAPLREIVARQGAKNAKTRKDSYFFAPKQYTVPLFDPITSRPLATAGEPEMASSSSILWSSVPLSRSSTYRFLSSEPT